MFTRLILMVGLAYCAYGALLFALQRRTLYPGAYMDPGRTRPDVAGAEAVALRTSSGRTEAWYVGPAPGSDRPSPAVIVFHGNAEFARDLPAVFGPLATLGVATLFVEYPGYDGSEGSPTERSIRVVAEAAFDWIARKPEVDGERIVVLGRSLGTGVAAALSRTRPVRGLVLWSPFVSVGYFAWHGFRLPPFLARDRWDVRAALQSFDGPVLIFHGRLDRIIPYRHAEVLEDAAPHSQLVTWRCGHNDCPPAPAAFWDPLADFLRRNGLLPPSR